MYALFTALYAGILWRCPSWRSLHNIALRHHVHQLLFFFNPLANIFTLRGSQNLTDDFSFRDKKFVLFLHSQCLSFRALRTVVFKCTYSIFFSYRFTNLQLYWWHRNTRCSKRRDNFFDVLSRLQPAPNQFYLDLQQIWGAIGVKTWVSCFWCSVWA